MRLRVLSSFFPTVSLWNTLESTGGETKAEVFKDTPRTSLVVQGLRLCFQCRGMPVQSLVGELGSHMPWSY